LLLFFPLFVTVGQGFPDFKAPEFIKQAVADAVNKDINQYTRSAGHLKLVQQLAKIYSDRLGRTVDEASEIVVANGASEIMFAAMHSMVNPGDEVIVFEPAFENFIPQIKSAGGIVKFVPLATQKDAQSGETTWELDVDELKAAFSEKTRAVIINTVVFFVIWAVLVVLFGFFSILNDALQKINFVVIYWCCMSFFPF
jgi:aspartate/methionine/tyrosine aminotransferase